MAPKNATVGADIQVPVYDAEGAKTDKTVVLPGSIFDVPLNVPLIHQVVEAQRAAARQGTASTKTRADVAGGGKKPWRQKGTGRARQGSIRAPQWKGGGVVHGPHPRDYSQRTPKKMIAGALRSALSDRARNDAILVFEGLVSTDVPSTKAAIETLRNATDAPKVLVVINREEFDAIKAAKSYSNIPGVHVLWADQLNAYDVVNSDCVVITEAALDQYVTRVQNARARVATAEVTDSKDEAIQVEKADKTTESYEERVDEKADKKAEKAAKEDAE